MPDKQPYAWVAGSALAEAYCLTLVHGLQPVELLQRLGAEVDEAPLVGLDEVAQRCWSMWAADTATDRLAMCVTSVGEWAVGVEINGYLGVTDAVLADASRGTTLVSHFQNVNGLGDFVLAKDGQVVVRFDPLFADARSGTAPDSLLDQMAAAGFDFSEDGDVDDPLMCTFALAERVTGIRITEQLLNQATYRAGTVSLP